MKTNHELPREMLPWNNVLNDFDFILFDLYEKDETYKEFFQKNRSTGRTSILDNSAYEFFLRGETNFPKDRFKEVVEELDPTFFIIPDVLMDKEKTIENFKEWKTFMLERKRMVVPQGKSLKEWLECYQFFIDNQQYYDAIGIPFHNDFFWDIGKVIDFPFSAERESALNDDELYATGRCFLLKYLKKMGLVLESKYYHLLGSHWYKEFKVAKEHPWISSIDTSFPVTRGIAKKPLDDKSEKEKISIETFFGMSLDEEQIGLIRKNITDYKNQ